MPYLTQLAATKPWYSRFLRHLARKMSGSIHTHTYLLTNMFQNHTGLKQSRRDKCL